MKQCNQYGTLEEREEQFKIDFEEKYKQFKYLEGYITREEPFKCICRKCYTIKEINAQCVKKSKNHYLRCNHCYQEEIKERNIKRKTNNKNTGLQWKAANKNSRPNENAIEKWSMGSTDLQWKSSIENPKGQWEATESSQ